MDSNRLLQYRAFALDFQTLFSSWMIPKNNESVSKTGSQFNSVYLDNVYLGKQTGENKIIDPSIILFKNSLMILVWRRRFPLANRDTGCRVFHFQSEKPYRLLNRRLELGRWDEIGNPSLDLYSALNR